MANNQSPLSMMSHAEAAQLKGMLESIKEESYRFVTSVNQKTTEMEQERVALGTWTAQKKNPALDDDLTIRANKAVEIERNVLKHTTQIHTLECESVDLAWGYREDVLMFEQKLGKFLADLESKYPVDPTQSKGFANALRRLTEGNRKQLDNAYPTLKKLADVFSGRNILKDMEEARNKPREMLEEYKGLQDAYIEKLRNAVLRTEPYQSFSEAEREVNKLSHDIHWYCGEQFEAGQAFQQEAVMNLAQIDNILHALDKVHGRDTKKG